MNAPSNTVLVDNTISVMLLRLQSMELLIPKAMIADVLSWNKDDYINNHLSKENWQLGDYAWHGRDLPLICLEKLIQTEHADESMFKRKVIILKCVENKEHHYALQCNGFPKPLILNESSLDRLSQSVEDNWCAYTLLIGSRLLHIPDFHQVEKFIFSDYNGMIQSA